MKKIMLVLLFIIVLGFALYILKERTAFFYYYKNRGSVKIVRDIVYKEGSQNPKQQLDLYLPKDKKDFPVVHFVHGGYWRSGDKNYYEWLTGLYANVGIALAKEGIGVVIQNYRLYPEAKIENEIADVRDGILWTEHHIAEYGGSGSIFLMGHSAGGTLIALVGSSVSDAIDRSHIKGYIALSAVWGIQEMITNSSAIFNKETSYPIFGDDAVSQEKYSPSAYLKNFDKPIFIAVGGNDYKYLQNQAEETRKILQSFGKPYEYVVAPRYIHEDMVLKFGSSQDPLLPKTEEFVKKLQ